MKRVCGTVAAAAVAAVAAGECGSEDTLLQLLHIQDVSYSVQGMIGVIVPEMASVFAAMESAYNTVEYGLTSFSDKPVRPHGDPNGDYCYREDEGLAVDVDLEAAVNDLTVLSGLDWRESQFDGVKYSIESEDLGWIREDTAGALNVQRVLLLVTNSLPHLEGTLPEAPGGVECDVNDYPSEAEITSLLEDSNTKLIVVSSGDVRGMWESLVGSWPNAAVLPDGEFASVPEVVLDFLCEDPSASSPEPIPTEEPLTTPEPTRSGTRTRTATGSRSGTRTRTATRSGTRTRTATGSRTRTGTKPDRTRTRPDRTGTKPERTRTGTKPQHTRTRPDRTGTKPERTRTGTKPQHTRTRPDRTGTKPERTQTGTKPQHTRTRPDRTGTKPERTQTGTKPQHTRTRPDRTATKPERTRTGTTEQPESGSQTESYDEPPVPATA